MIYVVLPFKVIWDPCALREHVVLVFLGDTCTIIVNNVKRYIATYFK